MYELEVHDREPTWAEVVRDVLFSLGGEATLATLSFTVAGTSKAQNSQNRNIPAKVRQQVQTSSWFERVRPGTWALSDEGRRAAGAARREREQPPG